MTSESTGYGIDPDVTGVYRELEAYSRNHPLAEIGVFRRDQDRLSVRIIDPDFRGLSWRQRNDRVLSLLCPASADKLSVLLLMTPEEAAESHVSSAEFDEPHSCGPVTFQSSSVFRERFGGHMVYVTVGRPFRSTQAGPGERMTLFEAAVKIDHPPGVIMADDESLSVDAGEVLRDSECRIRWFKTADEAKNEGFEAARRKLGRLAAA